MPGTEITRVAPKLLLVAAMLAATCGDKVTWSGCDKNLRNRVLARGEQDNNASRISLRCCKIDQINVDDLKALPKLEIIILWDNDIRQLDPAMFRSTPLVWSLDLAINKLSAVPVFGAYSVLPNLYSLNLNSNEITRLDDPKTFASTKNLTWLSMSGNKIEYIHPDMFGGLSNIISIHLDNNKLAYIPDKMFDMPSLEYLYLANNLIEYVAPAAFRSSCLLKLHLQDNRLTHLPDSFIASIAANSRLEDFCFHNNPWTCRYLLAQINVTKNIECEQQATGFYGTEPVCSSCGIVDRSTNN